MLTNFVLGVSEGSSGINLGDIAFQLLAFAVLLFLLKKFAWGPLMNIMKEREQLIAGEIKEAEESRAQAAAQLEEHRKLLAEARTEAQGLVESAKKQAEQQREEIIVAAREESERLREAAKLEIETQKEQAVTALREQVASLSVLVASKVIEKELTAADQDKYIQQLIKEAGEER
ncbi:ATP synthase F0F1 subunit B [Bacillus coahuilensis m2-6]|uniref:ATP synthase subunit b n=1 Tax=Bacillus coahuilensis p1.1.43 TaxID=1150625 RepID=A0A147K4A7_9BACI|nr:F0F1 ATP synthase subunit B [Bacillus coahuilensis]KUP04155.1 ATP synthase F0F1 subunit B [Bacillus coahuilensis p1.1.43]KUP05054.1 ATP synthase F0F1 subunit B [Bacillus coahuilensis m2-6]